MRYLLYLVIFCTVAGCGGSSDFVPTPTEEPSIEVVAPPACFQKTHSPSYPDALSDFIEISLLPLTNEHYREIAEVYDCLADQGVITIEEYNCLLLDLDNLQIATVRGTKGIEFSCGNQCTSGGCIRDNTFVISETATPETLDHEACHRASHLTVGKRGHDPETGFWIPDPDGTGWDCTCQGV